ncbi:hypothetical protein IWQ61_003217 [Dispira simplex]|nr:hypothetical protein IWQ61_003217 [Dispira simplex]
MEFPLLLSIQRQALDRIQQEFAIGPDNVQTIIRGMHRSMEQGLAKPGQTLAMLPSFIVNGADGIEKGKCLALDLGGTNFRVCQINLKGVPGEYRMVQKKYLIPQTLKTAPATELFGFIADGIHDFLRENGENDAEEHTFGSSTKGKNVRTISLGFTFSFPVRQKALNHGELTQWNKGFTCSGAVGHNVPDLLQRALQARNINAEVTALLNDTVGALTACSYRYPGTLLGVILGTGSNVAYMEKISRIPKFLEEQPHLLNTPAAEQDMGINMEWGSFDNEGDVVPSNQYDQLLDDNSPNQKNQMFEKRISGLYLGELFRLVILDLIRRQLLFSGKVTTALETPYLLDSSLVSAIVDDSTPKAQGLHPKVRVKLITQLELDENNVSDADLSLARGVACAIATRSARLAGTGLSAVLLRRQDRLAVATPDDPITIGIDGSLYEHFTTFREVMIQTLTSVIGEENFAKLRIVLAKDGSGVGAAVAATMNSELPTL